MTDETKATHTPGKLTVSFEPDSGGPQWWVFGKTKGDHLVAEFYNEGDAYLFAAAPETKAELEELREHTDYLPEALQDMTDTAMSLQSLIEEIREALRTVRDDKAPLAPQTREVVEAAITHANDYDEPDWKSYIDTLKSQNAEMLAALEEILTFVKEARGYRDTNAHVNTMLTNIQGACRIIHHVKKAAIANAKGEIR